MPYELTLAEPDAEKVVKKLGGSGQEELLKQLQRHPLAVSELGRPVHLDHIYLLRYQDTDFCQWLGRGRDGYFHPIGRVMKIIKTGE